MIDGQPGVDADAVGPFPADDLASVHPGLGLAGAVVERRQGDRGQPARGDVVGEAGLFYEKRTANVDATEDCRLLCLSQSNLDHLSRRYPFIATKVFRNLNKILATRLFTTTHRLT